LEITGDRSCVYCQPEQPYRENSEYNLNNSTTSPVVYWITQKTNVALQNGLRKALIWRKLNKTHQQEFEKDLVLFRISGKETYEFFGYVYQYSKEGELRFYGRPGGTSLLEFVIKDDNNVVITLDSREDITDLLKMLQGKSLNTAIDNVFH